MSKIRMPALCGAGFGLCFGIVSLVFYFGDWKRLLIVFSMGVFVGLLAAPEFKPELYKNAALFQLVSGAVAGSLAGVLFLSNVEGAILGLFLGGLLGWLAPYWLKHVQLP